MVISKKTTFSRFKRGPTFSRSGPTFPGGGGFLMLISIETQITCDCAAAQTVFIEELAHLIYKVQ